MHKVLGKDRKRKLSAHQQPFFLPFTIFVVFVSFLASAAPVSSQEYSRYCNERYGFYIDYPKNLVMEPPPANDDGRKFHDQSDFMMLVYGSNNVLDDTLEPQRRSQSEDFDRITYRVSGRNWFIMSGYKGTDIVYIKTYVGVGSINHLYIKYPAQKKKAYTAIVTKISRSFKPGDLTLPH